MVNDNRAPSAPGGSLRPLPRHLSTLQYLRGFAAMSVVYYHATIQVLQISGRSDFPKFGAFGVDIFFVLSGVVMWLTTCTRKGGSLDFMRKRVIRVVPLYWAVTLAAVSISLLSPELLRSTVYDSGHALASLLFVPWRNRGVSGNLEELFYPIVIPGWTLNMEMMFYLLFALCLPLFIRFRVLVLSALITAVYITGALANPATNPLSFYGDVRVFEFLAGVVLAAYVLPYLTLKAWIAGALLCISSITIAASELRYLEAPHAIGVGLPAFLIVASCLNVERTTKPPAWPVLEGLGDASYSIYLTHVFTISGMRVALHMAGVEFSEWVALAFVPASMLASIIVGVVAHHVAEKPLVQLTGRLLGGRVGSLDKPALR